MTIEEKIPLELLAPAGNMETGKVAIDHGADAVYIGAEKFSARSNAANTLEEIAELIDYAHLFNARVYLALNTILTDSEIKEAAEIIQSVYEAGCDGLIFQDAGILELDLPPIPLIASTQMHNIDSEKIKFLEDSGVQRVILARELSIKEIKEIRLKTNVELECFVHGALCVSYSGQCYLSQAAFGRSGNKGVCAQPCRMKYTLIDGKGRAVIKDKYLLSLKDLNLINYLNEMAGAGVTSFKIEGRYKDVSYVKNVTSAYRRALDNLIEKSPGYKRQSSGSVEFNFDPDLKRTFNRGYTRYFINGHDDEKRASIYTPKSTGAKVGHVTDLGKKWFKMSGEELSNGDGICFISKDNELKGFRVDQIQKGRVFPNDIRGLGIGDELYRNYDHKFLKILGKKTAERKINVSMAFNQTDSEIYLSVRDEDGNSVNTTIRADYEPAKQPEKIKKQITSQLTSTGNTIFKVNEFIIQTSSPGFLPLSILNRLRRESLNKLKLERQNNYKLLRKKSKTGFEAKYPVKSLDYRANVLNNFAKRFYEKHGVEITEDAFEKNGNVSEKILMTNRYCIRRELGACLKKNKNFVPPLTLTDGKRSYRLKFDCNKCLMYVCSD